MTSGGCDRSWEAEALREGRLGPRDVESFERHCRICSACAEGLARDERLRSLVRGLPVAEPGQLALKRLRGRVLRDVTAGNASRSRLSRRQVVFASSLGIVFVAIAVFVGERVVLKTQVARAESARAAQSPAPLAGAVAPSPGAVWTQAREGGTERVDLEAGTLRVHVRSQGPGERFFVRLPDGEIEVRGTTFDVTALDGATRHVDVDEGTVVLRIRGSSDQSLGPGTRWAASESHPSSADEMAVAVGAASAPAAAIPRRRSGDTHDADGLAGDDGASVYVDAMRSFREGLYDRAATAFHAFALAYPLATEAVDASFLEALSLAQAGRGEAAALAAERHLERFPRSFHRKDASILVARAASRRGRCDEAFGVLAPWMTASPDAEIQSVLVACGDGGSASR